MADAAEAVGAAALLGLEVALLGAAAWRIAGRLTRDLIDRLAVALTLGLGATSLVLLALGAIGLLSRFPVAVVIVGGSTALLCLGTAPQRATPRAFGELDTVGRVAAGIAVATVAITLLVGLRGDSQEVDTRQYHAPNAGTWLVTHDLWELPPVVPGYATQAYPSNHTLTALMLMLPSGSDEVAYVVNAAWAALLIAASASAARSLGGRGAVGAIVGSALVLAPVSFHTHANSLMNDWAATGGAVAALAFALHVRRSATHLPWAAVAGVAAGLAAGSKYTGFVPAGATVLAVAALAPARVRVRCLAVTTATVVVLTGFWLVRNAVLLDNPLYPLALGPLEGNDSPLNVLQTTIADHVVDGRAPIVRRWSRLVLDLYGPLAVAVALATGAALWFRRSLYVLVAVAMAALTAVGYLVTPTTGGGPDGIAFLLASQLRYAMPAVAVGGALLAALVPTRWWWLSLGLVVHPVLQIMRGPGYRTDVDVTAALAGAVALAVVVAALFFRLPIPRFSAWPAIGVAAFGLAMVALLRAPDDPFPIERVVGGRGRVAVVQAVDVRSLMGRDFDVRIVGPTAGESAPILDATDLDSEIERLRPDAVAVGAGDAVVKPAGWNGPAGWRVAHRDDRVVIWVRR